MKFSGKMCLMIILKVTENQIFTLSLEDTLFEKTTGAGQIDFPSPSPAVLGLRNEHTIALGFPGFSLFPFSFFRCGSSIIVLIFFLDYSVNTEVILS